VLGIYAHLMDAVNVVEDSALREIFRGKRSLAARSRQHPLHRKYLDAGAFGGQWRRRNHFGRAAPGAALENRSVLGRDRKESPSLAERNIIQNTASRNNSRHQYAAWPAREANEWTARSSGPRTSMATGAVSLIKARGLSLSMSVVQPSRLQKPIGAGTPHLCRL